MPRPYSADLRVRVIGDISTGASRRAAERYGVSPSVVVLWAQRFEQTGSVAAKSSGGSTSPLEEHAGFLLGLITGQPDLTLDEVVAAMRKRGIPGSAPLGHWETITFVAGLRIRAMVAPFVVEGAMNGPMFLAYVKQCLAPTLRRGDIVIMDNVPVHRVAGVRATSTGLRSRPFGCQFMFEFVVREKLRNH